MPRRGHLGLWVTLAVVVSLVLAFTYGHPGASQGQLTAHGLDGTLQVQRFPSSVLRRPERVITYLPPGYASSKRRYPLIVFLHGVPGRPEEFVSNGFVARLDALVASGAVAPFVAAFPAGSDRPVDDNEWADSARAPSERWESYVDHDVVGLLESRYRLVGRREGRAIAGMSMGGFGAINIALHHRDRYAAAASWSGYFTANTPTVHDPSQAEGRAYSPQYYASRLTPALSAFHPALRFYVGSRDGFESENALFDRTLTELGVAHSYRVVPGAGHYWRLWVAQLPAELRFLRGALSGS